MHRKHWLVLSIAVVFALAFIGCAGEEGPQGPAGPAGEDGQGLEYTYVGGQGEYCAHCHARIAETWEGTLHPEAYADLEAEGNETNPYCVQCHVTGWDATVAYGDTAITDNDGPNMDGFDNYFGVDTEEAAARRAALEGVQCEACHGPVGEADPNTDAFLTKGEISFATVDGDGNTDVALCSPCHSGQLGEYVTSGHGTVADGDLTAYQDEHYAHSESCAGCHTSEGFVSRMDEAWTFDEAMEASGEMADFIGCVTCHDPHANPDGNYQLRSIADVTLAYDPNDDGETGSSKVVSGYGNGQLCMQCHHGRRDKSDVDGQIASGSGHFGPHSSPQADMFAGTGCYEISGYDYSDSLSNHQTFGALAEDACVVCHMRTVEDVHGLGDHYNHSFAPIAWLAGDEVGECEQCHTSLTENTFDIAGFQTATVNKMMQLANLIDATANITDEAGLNTWFDEFDTTDDALTTAQREAAYALYFVFDDGSKGVHNLKYSQSLLDNAINYMTP